jgi:hypothetical protein
VAELFDPKTTLLGFQRTTAGAAPHFPSDSDDKSSMATHPVAYNLSRPTQMPLTGFLLPTEQTRNGYRITNNVHEVLDCNFWFDGQCSWDKLPLFGMRSRNAGIQCLFCPFSTVIRTAKSRSCPIRNCGHLQDISPSPIRSYDHQPSGSDPVCLVQSALDVIPPKVTASILSW